MDVSKYAVGYYPAPGSHYKWVQKDHIEKAPAWCSVDLRDGNQSLVIPMSLEEKLEFYRMLLRVGFKEIEVGFPAASETEYNFLRTLIEQDMIPSDVTVQVLTQCREHIIRRTFEACKGAPSAIIHFYNSTSVAQREQVFRKSKAEIMEIAVEGARLVKKLASEYEGNFRFEYSPESFTGTEPEYALEVCNAVLDALRPAFQHSLLNADVLFTAEAILPGALPQEEGSPGIVPKEGGDTVGMVVMGVGEHPEFHLRRVQPQKGGILGKQAGGAGIQQQLVPPVLNVNGQTPLPGQPLPGQIVHQNGGLQLRHYRCRWATI